MSEIVQLLDYPEQLLISDGELYVREHVRCWTMVHLSHLLNHLNHYALRVMPWTRWHQTFGRFEFVFPTGQPVLASSQRKLVVVVAVTGKPSGTAAEIVKVATSTSGATWYPRAAAAGEDSATDWTMSEEQTTYLVFAVPTTADRRELVTVFSELAPASGVRLDGFGAWELPQRAGGDPAVSASGGIAIGAAAVSDAYSSVLRPGLFFTDEHIDATALAAVQSAMDQAWRENRRIIGSYGCADYYGSDHAMDLNCGGVAGSWVTPWNLSGGIFVPAYMNRRGATARTIRAVLQYRLATAGTAHYRITTSQGTFPSSTGQAIDSTALSWSPIGSPFDPTANGIALSVGNADEWINVEMKQTDVAHDPHIHQIILWEDAP